MKTTSYTMPEATEVERISANKCNILFAENIEEKTDGEGEKYYEYDLYILKNYTYHDNLESNIDSMREEWLQMAIDKENEPHYTDEQKIQQMITDSQLETLEIIMGVNE